MTEPATLHLTLPPGLSARITAHAALWGSSPEATAIYCLMARFPAPTIIEAVTECASAFRSRDAHTGPGEAAGELAAPGVKSAAMGAASERAPPPPDRPGASAVGIRIGSLFGAWDIT